VGAAFAHNSERPYSIIKLFEASECKRVEHAREKLTKWVPNRDQIMWFEIFASGSWLDSLVFYLQKVASDRYLILVVNAILTPQPNEGSNLRILWERAPAGFQYQLDSSA